MNRTTPDSEPTSMNNPPGPLLAWPSFLNLRSTLLMCLAFFFIFELLYGATSMLTGLHHVRIRVHFDFELGIPFVPAMAAVYLSLSFLLALAPFIFRTWKELVPLFVTMVVETLVGVTFFLLIPVEQAFPNPTVTGFWGDVFRLADLLNWEDNYVPSLHVAFAFTAAVAFGKRCGPLGRWFFLLWAAAIAASTILIHQHYLIDILTGIALALTAIKLVYRGAAKQSFLEAVRVERLCLNEFRHFSRRHARYRSVFATLYGISLRKWNHGRIVRATYCLAQHVDDVLDGDRDIGRDPETYVHDLVRQMEANRFDCTTTASELAAYVTPHMRAFQTESDNPLRDLLCLFEVLLFDRKRVRSGLILTREKLAGHHRKTFYYSLNIMLILSRARLRARDAAGLIAALSWCSPLRDLEEDLDRGLVNIPRAVIEQARRQGANTARYDQLIATAPVREWVGAEYLGGLSAIEQSWRELDGADDLWGKRILSIFLKAIERYAKQYSREHERLLTPRTQRDSSAGTGEQLWDRRF